MGRNYIAEGLSNPFGLNNTRRENTPQDVMKWLGGQLANPFGLNDSDRWDNGLGGGPRNTTPISKPKPTPSDTPIPPRIERKPGPFDPGYRKPNPTMDVIPEAAAEPEKRAGDVAFVPDSTLNNGRDNSRTNPNGIVQKGTDMSRSFNDLLATTNTSGYQPFSSNQLPTTGANPFSAQPPKTQSFDVAAPGVTGNSYDNYGADGGVAAASSTDRSQFTPMSGKEGRIEGGSERRKGGSLADALNDTAGINSYMSKFSSGDRERAANRAFLDTEGSMEGLRAKEAVNGVVYAEQNHYIAGSDADGPAQKITRDEARDISSGKTTADALLKSYTTSITETAKESPAQRQDPATLAQDAVKSGFAAGAKTDFELNNSQGATRTGVGPVVPTDQIPKDLSGAAGTKYLQDLDAGRLFK